jgi:hypothetical protein
VTLRLIIGFAALLLSAVLCDAQQFIGDSPYVNSNRPTIPNGVQAGDELQAFVVVQTSANSAIVTWNAPSGWTLKAQTANAKSNQTYGDVLAVFEHTATGADTTPQFPATVSTGSIQGYGAVMRAYRGSGSINGYSTYASTATTTTSTLPAIAGGNGTEVACFISGWNYTATLSPSMSNGYTGGTGSNIASFICGDSTVIQAETATWQSGTNNGAAAIGVSIGAASSLPTASVTITPSTCPSACNITVVDTSTDVTSCEGYWNGADMGSVPPDGSSSWLQSTSGSAYMICTGPGGSITSNTAAFTINSNPPPTASISIAPASCTSACNITVTDTSTNTTSCEGYWNGSDVGVVPVNGSTSWQEGGSGNFYITCTGPGGSAKSNTATFTIKSSGGGVATWRNFFGSQAGTRTMAAM